MSPERRDELLQAEFARLRDNQRQWRDAAVKAREALPRLVKVCAGKTGQSYHVRELLYSLWNGQAGKLIELLSLDWSIRCDVLAVCAGFGYEPPDGEACAAPSFFYDELSGAFKTAGLFEWFVEASDAANDPD